MRSVADCCTSFLPILVDIAGSHCFSTQYLETSSRCFATGSRLVCVQARERVVHTFVFGLFPVLASQLPGCSSAEARNGMFQVVDKPIMLHLGHDVENAMSCMIQADGILMGCSTFGQIAGLQSRGISMFSTQCGGDGTPQQYRMIPPLAVAERGRLWVPVLGSWYDPVLNATNVLSAALDTLLMQ